MEASGFQGDALELRANVPVRYLGLALLIENVYNVQKPTWSYMS